MERIQNINPERIRWCCDDRGISTVELAAQLHFPPSTLDKLMSGDGVSFAQLRRIADYFQRGVLFFMENMPVDDARVHSAQFRTLANQKLGLTPKIKALIERVEGQRNVYVNLRDELGGTDQPHFVAPPLATENPISAAAVTRQWLGLKPENTFDTYRAAVEKRGILVFRSNGHNGPWQIEKVSTICGFSLYDPVCPVIVIKKQPPAYESRQVFTLMHELGHILLHKQSFMDEESDLVFDQGNEREANEFAGSLLVPTQFLQQIRDETRPADVKHFDEWLAPFRRQWGVSGEVILRRLLDAGRLPQVAYEKYRRLPRPPVQDNEGGTRQYRYREPVHIFGAPFVQTVLDALNATKISLYKASNYLDNLKIKDMHELERHYGGV